MTWKPTTYTRHQLEERRLEAARLLKQRRLSKSLIAKRLGVSRAAVSQWAKRLRSGGLRRLHSRKSRGRPAQLTAHQKPPLLRLLKRGALAAGFPTDRWTLRRIQQVIKREFDVSYHPDYLSRFLKKLGWSPQYPAPRAVERNDKLVEAWLHHEWPRIKKSASNRRRNCVV
jgi:transposase